MKTIVVIPALLGSHRIADKHLLLVDGSPMLFYVVQACQQAGVFDEIYLNSEHTIFEKMAAMLGVKFLPRSPERGGSACRMEGGASHCAGTRCQAHDHFLYDCMEQLEPCYVACVNASAPLLTPETIRRFMTTLERDEYDSLISVEERVADTSYGLQPVAPSCGGAVATQTQESVTLLSWALAGWKSSSFLDAYRRGGCDQPGPSVCGKTGVFPLSRIEALHADTPDGLYMVEACLQHRRQRESPGQFRFTDHVVSIERCAKDVISRDGVKKFDDTGANSRLTNIREVKQRMGEAPWDYLVVFSQTDQVGMICQRPGESVRTHAHMTHAEWWMVLEGEFEWRFGDGSMVRAKPFDIVTVPRGLVHTILCTSREPGIRLACGARDMEHVYVR